MTFGHDTAKQWMNAEMSVYQKGKLLQHLRPEKRLYKTHEQPTTEVALLSTWRDDLYLVLAGYDEEKQEATFSAYVNPLIVWLWIGGWVMALGTLLAMVPLSRQAQALTPASRQRTLEKRHGKNRARRHPMAALH